MAGEFFKDYEIASGTFVGAEHVRLGKNNQDAWAIAVHGDVFVGVVSDGCGSHSHSEVGAKLASRFLADNICKSIALRFPMNELDLAQGSRFWERMRQDALMFIRATANNMGGSLNRTLNDYFLFTVMGVVMTPGLTLCFGIGDGVYALNGDLVTVGPFPGNAPPYLTYGLTGSKVTDERPELLQFQIHRIWDMREDLQYVLIGSDGLTHFQEAAETPLPGKEELLGPVSQFWTDDRYYNNIDNVRRRLYLANQAVTQPSWNEQRLLRFKGLLPDDTTLVVIRRIPNRVEE